MRITKVALAFFSIGFLAGSFERAAGLGHSELSRVAQDRAVNAAVLRSTTSAMASVGSFGGLPEELFSRPARPTGDMPPTVSAGLADALAEPDWAHLVPLPVIYSPELPRELTSPRPNGGQAERRRFGLGRPLSEPERVALSRMPPPVSLPGPWDDVPSKTKAVPERDVPAQNAGGPEFIMPFERGRVTSLFHQGRYHPAIDLAGPLGSRVQATTRRQKVTYAGWQNGYGNVVVTRDDTGRMHLYGHLQRIVAKVGAILDQGQMLGTLGSTGHSTGPHVHYELKTRAGAHMDPVTFLFGRRVGRGYAWNGSRSVTRLASRNDGQPRPR
jgi:murein DD-endopeptidase MepM/ murein hydrolase activator NlpD